ncbi:beta-alanyl-dopamine/carcinine hydrolase-like isoform X2 [Scylla paramamosain]|uniref:beta-alanyl-dopamine/carcinine hydrolase-like isoform X2 n=1 Tax=Scylla paramamosain TaxID=85552 RepID=UPI003083ED7E
MPRPNNASKCIYGRTFRSLIQEYLGVSKVVNKLLLPAYETKEGRAAYDSTLASLTENYPHYVKELEGTADGAQVPFHQLMLLHVNDAVFMAAGLDLGEIIDTPTGCSSLSINKEGQILLGHTEDALGELLNYVYIVSARIHDKPRGRQATLDENFTALCYAGHLPGFCMGYNHHGLTFSINVICPRKVLAAKTPRHFLCRALLSAKTIGGAHDILRDEGTGSAHGFSVNMVFMHQDGDYLFENVEIGPAENCNESPLSIVTLSLGEHLLHTNKYLRLTNITEEDGKCMESSNLRHARASQFPAPKNCHDLLELLSDTEDSTFPFFREGSEKDPAKTVALGVFDLVKKTWTIWMRNPRTADPLLEIPLLFTWST